MRGSKQTRFRGEPLLTQSFRAATEMAKDYGKGTLVVVTYTKKAGRIVRANRGTKT